MSSFTIDLDDNDPNELILAGNLLEAFARYRSGQESPGSYGERDGVLETFSGEPGIQLPTETLVPGPQPEPAKRTRKARKSDKVKTADLNPDIEPPLPFTATETGTPLADDAQAVAAAITGSIVLLDSSGTPKASYATPELAASALIEILKAAPNSASLDNLLTVNSSTLGKLGKESDRVIEAYGNLVDKLKTAAAPTANPVDKLLEEIGDSVKPPAATAAAPVVVGPVPPAEQLVQACGDLLQVYARDKGKGFVGALNLLTKEFGVDNIKKIDAAKLPSLYKRLAELVQGP